MIQFPVRVSPVSGETLGAPMDELDDFGRSEMHYAARDGDASRVSQLIAAGSDATRRDSAGWTPLHFAALANSASTVVALLSAGAPVDPTDSYGNTPLFRAVFSSSGDGSVIEVLRAAGADPMLANKSGVSPVMLARRIGNYDIAQYFTDIPEPGA